MEAYIYPITAAAAVFPLLSAIITLPYVIFQYHKYGALLILRIVVVYSFIFYMITSYFLTILPLPAVDSVQYGQTHMLLVPFDALRRWWESSGLVLDRPSTYLSAITNYDFLQILFNILLLVPFGVYLRYYFERKWYQVLIMSFLYSLFFELTQLSGLYGIYPYPYRWFEVDDLICNTLGGMLGFLITPGCSFFLPDRERLDEMSYKKGRRISIFRRGIANLTDIMIVLVTLYGIYRVMIAVNPENKIILLLKEHLVSTVVVSLFLYFVLISVILSGRTVGKLIVNTKMVHQSGGEVKFYQYIIRFSMIYLLILPAPEYLLQLLDLFQKADDFLFSIMYAMEMGVLFLIFMYADVSIFLNTIVHKPQMLYDRFSHIVQISTVRQKAFVTENNESDISGSQELVRAEAAASEEYDES